MKINAPTIESLKFDYVSSNIYRFPRTEVRNTEFKVFKFEKYLTSEKVIAKILKDGYLPASLDELLCYAENGWNNSDSVVALGSVAEVNGDRSVPCLFRLGSGRYLSLFWFDVGWGPFCRFLAVRDSVSQTSELGPSDTLTLPDELVINGATYRKV